LVVSSVVFPGQFENRFYISGIFLIGCGNSLERVDALDAFIDGLEEFLRRGTITDMPIVL
jgi:hypothetical protein